MIEVGTFVRSIGAVSTTDPFGEVRERSFDKVQVVRIDGDTLHVAPGHLDGLGRWSRLRVAWKVAASDVAPTGEERPET